MQIFDRDHVGCTRAAPITHSTSVASKRRRCCSGESGDGGYFAGSGRFKSGAISGIASAALSPASRQRGLQLRELLLR